MDSIFNYNYTPPTIQEIDLGKLKVYKKNNSFILQINDKIWTTYNYKNHQDAKEFFLQYFFAKGHVVTTGLGLGVKENWLLTKPEVTKLTVIEKHKEVIDYHTAIKSPLINKAEIIIEDAKEYKGKCDTLLLDHYEKVDIINLLNEIKIITKNIKHKTLWFWLLEQIIMSKNIKSNSIHTLPDILKHYKELRNKLITLPDITSENIFRTFISVMNNK